MIWKNDSEVLLYDPSVKDAKTLKLRGEPGEDTNARLTRVRRNAAMYLSRYLNLYWIYKVHGVFDKVKRAVLIESMRDKPPLRVTNDGTVVTA